MALSYRISSIEDLLNQFRARIQNPRDRGTAFEKLMKSFLTHDPLYSARFKKVSMWSEWEHCWGPDCGIDLVAEDFDGGFTAIQCKFFAADYQIQKGDIDSFFTESGRTFQIEGKRTSFLQRIIVSSSDIWSQNAENSLSEQTIDVVRIHVRDLDQSPIDWNQFSLEKPDKIRFRRKKSLRPHQENAISDVLKGFRGADRGKLIMACGTGKTFTALKLAEKVAPKNGNVLFLVPSISLLSQTLREWTAECERPFHAFAVCSDQRVGRDSEDASRHDLAIPATTDTAALLKGYERAISEKQTVVVFSTYQSIDVISKAQKKGLPEFDIVICDEAHRTTGVTLANEDESHFVKIHNNKVIKAAKRLYMTATPRIFGSAVKEKANEAGAELCSMDDVSVFGPEFHRLGFGQAVSQNLLTDYKVLVLAVDESVVTPSFQKQLAGEQNELPLEDIAKIVGCWNGLSKRFVGSEAEVEDANPMRRAVAFARSIKDSKQIASIFQSVVASYIGKKKSNETALKCELEHVDGTFNVLDRNARLDWLKAETPDNTCRILSNARCLSEGVDVPALDAVLFLNSRDSQVDVVQSVGRIMRRSEGKKYGYIILPVAIPVGVPPEVALKDNKRYKVVWQVLQALRAHDDRFDAVINQMQFNKNKPKPIQVIGIGGAGSDTAGGNGIPRGSKDEPDNVTQLSLTLPQIEEWKDSIYARIVLKCGSRLYWENWAADVAKIAERHNIQMKELLERKDPQRRIAFEKFLSGIRKNINPSIGEDDAIEMLSQHLITKPIFDALFEHYPFTERNPVSQSIQALLDTLKADGYKENEEKLEVFYESVRMRVRGIDNAEGRQRLIVELYDRFFKLAFPKMSDRLGIVYTPVEIVDYIVNSVDFALKTEFGTSVSEKGVHILDPFTGTGTFIVRLLQSGLLKPEDLKRKFSSELHANEIVLLAYYIAAINIEETYHAVTKGDYKTFNGIVLTDTFQSGEPDNQTEFDLVIPKNSERVVAQRQSKIQVIMSNPPYSSGQDDQNENNQNLNYPDLDSRIEKTYGAKSKARSVRNLYDSYVRALRWATDRLDERGVLGFVTNGSFIDASNMDGLRRTLGVEYSKIYCFNLRGNQRTAGERSRKEGGKVFGSGSRAPVAVTIFIKDSNRKGDCEIYYYDVGDYVSKDDKLMAISNFKSIENVPWTRIVPNSDGDWINQRAPEFETYLEMGNKEDSRNAIFEKYSLGVATSRDVWAYSFDKLGLEKKIKSMIQFYNSEAERYLKRPLADKSVEIGSFLNNDSKKISWSRGLKQSAAKGKRLKFDSTSIVEATYRPFTKQWMYYSRDLNDMVYQVPKLFPTPEHQNLVIAVTGVADRKGFTVLATDRIPDLNLLDATQCFPLYYYEKADDLNLEARRTGAKPDKHGYIKRNAISDQALQGFRDHYADDSIDKDAIFNYVYGVLHSPAYRERFESDLQKRMPRIPFLKGFQSISNIGRSLIKLHARYDNGPKFNLKIEIKNKSNLKADQLYRIGAQGIKFAKSGRDLDKTKIIYNENIAISGIPMEAHDYLVNSKSAVEWIVDRYSIALDKKSGISNDVNKWFDTPTFVVDLIAKAVWLSLETNRLISELPEFDVAKEVGRTKSKAK
ncbi:MAG: DEAD/DEAH box helicase [Proteobacteria bacterium]|nr:MAG: DEAD/DEAH box helicase [Pseudomonadota bacterium]